MNDLLSKTPVPTGQNHINDPWYAPDTDTYTETAVLAIQPAKMDDAAARHLIADLRRILRNSDLVAMHHGNLEITLVDEKAIELRGVLNRIDQVFRDRNVAYQLAMASSPSDGPENAQLLMTARTRLEALGGRVSSTK